MEKLGIVQETSIWKIFRKTRGFLQVSPLITLNQLIRRTQQDIREMVYRILVSFIRQCSMCKNHGLFIESLLFALNLTDYPSYFGVDGSN